jgi:NADH-quinone oxidoreductase subunit N
MLAVGGMMTLIQANDLIVIFLGLELLSLCLYVLTGFAYPRFPSEEAAMKYLVIGAFAAGFLVFGIAMVYGATGSSNLPKIGEYLGRQTLVAEDYAFLLIGMVLVLIGLSYKIAIAPFHMWTPDVYEGAPTSVTAFMSVGTKAAAVAALIRVLTVALPTQAAIWVPALAALAAITLVVGNVTAVMQTNVKRMMAYSSVGHAGYVLMGVLAVGTAATAARGVESVLFYLVAYTFTNLLAFAVLMAIERRGETIWNLNEFTGMWAKRPWLGIMMSISMLSLAGAPPTAGFIGKLYVFTAAWQAGLWWLTLIGIITSAIAAFFYLRIIVQMFMRDPVLPVRPLIGRSMLAVMLLTSVCVVLIGVLPAPVINLVEQSVLALGH